MSTVLLASPAATATTTGAGSGGEGRRHRRGEVVGVAVLALAAAAVGAWALSGTGAVTVGLRPAASRSHAGANSLVGAASGARATAAGATEGSARPGGPVATRTPHASAPTAAAAAPAARAMPAAPAAAAPVAPAVPAPVAVRGIVPPDNPAANIPPSPNFLDACSGAGPDQSAGCQQATLRAIDAARAAEGLPAMVLPSDWSSLTPAEQLFTATNLERTVRGLPPLSAMDVSLDQAAATGAAESADPPPPAGYPYRIWASNWGGALGSPLEAVYLWMYDDGPGSANVDCPTAGAPGCWGHRDNVLVALPCQECVMGAAFDPTGWKGYPAWAELLVETQGTPDVAFAWNEVTPYLPASER